MKYKRFKVVEIDSFPALDEALEINYDLNKQNNKLSDENDELKQKDDIV